jgi:hypothetical protein
MPELTFKLIKLKQAPGGSARTLPSGTAQLFFLLAHGRLLSADPVHLLG